MIFTILLLVIVAGMIGLLNISTFLFIFLLKGVRERRKRREAKRDEWLRGLLERYEGTTPPARTEAAGLRGAHADNIQTGKKPAIRVFYGFSPVVMMRTLNIARNEFSKETTEMVVAVANLREIQVNLAGQLLTGRKKWDRVQAAYELTNFGEQAVPFLKEGLKAKDTDVAYNCAQALGLIHTGESFDALLHFLPHLESYSGSRIAQFLENYVDVGADTLFEACSDPNPAIRFWTAYLLGYLKTKRSLDHLVELASDKKDSVRASAAKALGMLGFKEAGDKLVALLDDDFWVVRNNAVKSLRLLGISSAAPKIALLLRDRKWWIRENAADALASFGDVSIPILTGMLEDEDAFARNRAGETLARIGLVDRKVEELRERPGDERVLELLKKVRNSGAIKALEKYLGDEDETLRREIEKVLAS